MNDQLPRTRVDTQPPPGTPDAAKRHLAQKLWWIIVPSCVILSIVGVWLLGQVQQGALWLSFRDLLGQGLQVDFIEARDGVVLLTRSERSRSEVLIQSANEVGWRSISTNDFTARNPALSPSGDQVAYLSGKDDVHIAVVSLISNTQRSVTATILDTPLSTRQLTGLTICPWSVVQWSPKEPPRLAFFVCSQKPAVSYAAVADLSFDPYQIVWVEESGVPSDKRSLIWLDATHLLIGTPALDHSGTTVETIKVSP